jgi:hypothetical protein
MNAHVFASQWIACWNSHDLGTVLRHYSDDVEITTPMIRLATGIEAGTLSGKDAVGRYWKSALEKLPDLHFELIDVTTGVNSIVLYYKSLCSIKSLIVLISIASHQCHQK